MSLHIDFEPHSWYRGFAIKHNNQNLAPGMVHTINPFLWSAYTANGITGYVDTLEAQTLRDLKTLITDYRGHKQ